MHAFVAASNCSGSGDLFATLCRDIDVHVSVLGPLVEHVLPAVLVFAVVLLAGWLVRRAAHRLVGRAGGDRQVRTLVHNLVTAATFGFAILGGLTAAGLDVSVLLTFGGIATVAIGLAFQDVLRNLFAGLVLLVERPFRLGDTVTVSDHVGVVETINLRTTALRTPDGQLAILPNLFAFNSAVVNASAYDVRRYSVIVRLADGVDLEAMLRNVRGELDGTADIAGRPEPRIVPRLDVEGGVELTCTYWLAWRDHDADAVAADLARRLYAATGRQGVQEVP